MGFADDRLDCQTIPLASATYAGQKFSDVFTPAQQTALGKVFPTGVCDYSKPGRAFQAAVIWLTYQDAGGTVIYGGAALGPSPVSLMFAVAGSILPATGAGPPFAVVAAALLGLAVLLRRGLLGRDSVSGLLRHSD